MGMDHWMSKRREEFGTPPWSDMMPKKEVERLFLHNFAIEINIRYVGNGWYEFQLWKLLGLFGELFNEGMGLQSPTPFSTDIVLIERELKLLEPTRT